MFSWNVIGIHWARLSRAPSVQMLVCQEEGQAVIDAIMAFAIVNIALTVPGRRIHQRIVGEFCVFLWLLYRFYPSCHDLSLPLFWVFNSGLDFNPPETYPLNQPNTTSINFSSSEVYLIPFWQISQNLTPSYTKDRITRSAPQPKSTFPGFHVLPSSTKICHLRIQELVNFNKKNPRPMIWALCPSLFPNGWIPTDNIRQPNKKQTNFAGPRLPPKNNMKEISTKCPRSSCSSLFACFFPKISQT